VLYSGCQDIQVVLPDMASGVEKLIARKESLLNNIAGRINEVK